jgi:hypothetical protein
VSDLQENLKSALAAIDPGPAPVEAAMRNGGKIRNRRRVGLLAGTVAIVAAAVVGVPAFAHHAALPPAPVTGHIRVTVNPPGPHSPAGLIASGLIGTKPWNLSVESPDSKNCMFTGAGMSSYACNGDLAQATANDPIVFEGGGGQTGTVPTFVNLGVVWKDVASARVELSDGTLLTLHPVKIDGMRFVAFAIPMHLAVDSVTAYSASGEIAAAIPYQQPGGAPIFQEWLRPGQAVPAQVSGVFGSGTVDGRAWRATAHLGPWGTCLVYEGNSGCFDPSQHPATGAFVGSASWVAGTAAESVSYLIITLKDGSAVRVGVTAVGPEKFWGVGFGEKAHTGAHWTAYNIEGKAVGSGSVI